jgi:hypothetical protein
MTFNKFIIIIGAFLGTYYFVIILFDLLKSKNNIVNTFKHSVQFEKSQKPIIISGDSEEMNLPVNLGIDENIKKYLPSDGVVISEGAAEKKSPIIDLGLETISGDAHTLSAENLSKFMFHRIFKPI